MDNLRLAANYMLDSVVVVSTTIEHEPSSWRDIFQSEMKSSPTQANVLWPYSTQRTWTSFSAQATLQNLEKECTPHWPSLIWPTHTLIHALAVPNPAGLWMTRIPDAPQLLCTSWHQSQIWEMRSYFSPDFSHLQLHSNTACMQEHHIFLLDLT